MAFKYMGNNRELNLWEKLYIPEIAKGMTVSLRHFFRSWPVKKGVVTQSYPEERFPLSYRSRGRHYLTRRSDGRLACVACMMCAMACPANVIKIEIGELAEPYVTGRQKIDRYPTSFTIDQLTCIYCGYCVEACPEDAIRMDSGNTMPAVTDRRDAVQTIDLLAVAEGRERPEAEHDRIVNPRPGDEPVPAPHEVLDAETLKRREY